MAHGGRRAAAGRKPNQIHDGAWRRMVGDWCERESAARALEAATNRRIDRKVRLREAVDKRETIIATSRLPRNQIANVVGKMMDDKLRPGDRMLREVKPLRGYGQRDEIKKDASRQFNCSARTVDDCWKLVRRLNAEVRALWIEVNEET